MASQMREDDVGGRISDDASRIGLCAGPVLRCSALFCRVFNACLDYPSWEETNLDPIEDEGCERGVEPWFVVVALMDQVH